MSRQAIVFVVVWAVVMAYTASFMVATVSAAFWALVAWAVFSLRERARKPAPRG